MARYRGSVCKLCRREGMKLFLKGRRCLTDKCALEKKSKLPGEHGHSRPRFSDYAVRLREKQKAKRIYGISEKQFRNYFLKSEKMKGVTGEILLQFLERRLDNVVFRSNFAVSHVQARQLVAHGNVFVNGKKVDIPSYLVKKGDVISIRDNERIKKLIKENMQLCEERVIPEWLELNKGKLETKVLRIPTKDDITIPIQEQLIVEFYSR
jgi:small subunit ribosomal protein S4